MSDEDDKRSNFRQRAGLQVSLVARPGHPLPAGLRLISSDVSLTGMSCASNLPLEPGTELGLRLSLVGGGLAAPGTIDVGAKVLRCTIRKGAPEVRRHGIAVAFTAIAAQDRRTLQRYLNNL
jgi:hypothetical protein